MGGGICGIMRDRYFNRKPYLNSKNNSNSKKTIVIEITKVKVIAIALTKTIVIAITLEKVQSTALGPYST